MSFKLHQEPQVECSAQAQLELKIEQARHDMKNPYELIEHVIKLYGAEFVKANDRIAALEASVKASGELLQEQKRANDELFRIKQKVVIANRQLMARNKELERANLDLRSRLVHLAELLEGAALDFTHHTAIRELLKFDVEEHKVRAEDTPA